MNTRILALIISLAVFSLGAYPTGYHHDHHHYAELTKGELVEIVKEQQSELYWKVLRARVETGAVLGAVAFLVGYVIGKTSR